MRFFLVDKVTAIEVGKTISGIKCVTLTDEVLHDHFPDHPIIPGTLVVEGLAQLTGFLLELSINTSDSCELRRAMLAQITKMKFHETTGPGECLQYSATIKSLHNDAAQVEVEAHKNGKSIVKGSLNFALILADSKRITEQRQQLYNIWTRDLDNCPTFR